MPDFAVKVSSKPTKKQPAVTKMYDSIAEALDDLNLKGVPLGAVMSSLTGKREYVKGYKFELEKLTL